MLWGRGFVPEAQGLQALKQRGDPVKLLFSKRTRQQHGVLAGCG